MKKAMKPLIECPLCGEEYDPVSSRWLCPYCHFKDTCCEGEPCPQPVDGAESST